MPVSSILTTFFRYGHTWLINDHRDLANLATATITILAF
ncbi:hypothetical protein CZ787_06485 [Halomonas citrativorans]|uniref:Uncharacterized protein n=1 Tax=Halomonas citrativorans TaxID=2742612 RepID=A0A1R4HVZ9_9GAMM|nr:hypothetical protein CZ787_06485 [Halomonas citrativorans]